VYREEPALWEVDGEPEGFRWLDASDAAANVLAFLRLSRDGQRTLVCVCNLSPVPRPGYRVGLPHPGAWREVVSTDDPRYGGSGIVNGRVSAESTPWHGQPCSAELTLPPLGVVWLRPEAG
jgi:1,4-alpha-glucan branching enzyme